MQKLWEHWRGAKIWTTRVALGLALLPGMAVAAWIFFRATQNWGLGANSDGLTYLVLARYLYRGQGYGRPMPLGGWKPMTHFPPGYPALLASLMPLTQGDVDAAAWWLHLGLVAGVPALAGVLLFRVTRHVGPAAGLTLYLGFAYPWLRIATWVFSEAPFLALILLTGWALTRWHEKPTRGRALLVAGLAAAGTLVRWIGGVLFLWAGSRMVRHGRQAPEARRSMVVFLLGYGIPVAAWVLRNRLVAGNAVNRPLAWHPPGLEKWYQAAETLADWVRPWYATRTVNQTWALAASVVLVSAGLLVWAWRTATPSERDALALWLGFLAWYGGGLVAAISWVDALTPMDWRLLAPVFLVLVWLLALASWITLGRYWATALLLAWVAYRLARVSWTYDSFYLLDRMHHTGGALRNAAWQTAGIWQGIRALPPDVPLWTNELPELLYYADRPAFRLPHGYVIREGRRWLYDVTTGRWLDRGPAPQDATDWLRRLARQVQNHQGYIAFITVDPAQRPRERVYHVCFKPWKVYKTGTLLRPREACLTNSSGP